MDCVTCMRCGDLCAVEDLYITSIPYCLACLKRNDKFGHTPVSVPIPIWAAAAGLLGFLLLGGVLGIVSLPIIESLLDYFDPDLETCIFILVGFFMVFIALLGRFMFLTIDWFFDMWHKHLIQQFGLMTVIDSPAISTELARFWNGIPKAGSKVPSGNGLLISGSGGLLFVGDHEHACAIPFDKTILIKRYKPYYFFTTLSLEITFSDDSIYGQKTVLIKLIVGSQRDINRKMTAILDQFLSTRNQSKPR